MEAELLIGTFLVGLFLNFPVAYAMMGAVAVFLLVQGQVPLVVIPQRMVTQMDSFPLLAIPFFLLAGELMNAGGITDRIFLFARRLVGHITGGLGHVNVLASVIFSGMSGAMAADAAGLGTVEIKAMTEAGYDRKFSPAITAASAVIGPVIPPSIMMVIYGYIAGVSTGQLFLGGVVPGLLMGASMMVGVYLTARRRNYPVDPRASLREVWHSFRETALALALPVLLVGGILSGLMTVTEASVMAANYALILAVLVYREVRWRELASIFTRVAVGSATILFIISAASPLGWSLTWERIPQLVTQGFLALSSEPWAILLLVNVLLLLLGATMETTALMIILIPILMPLVQSSGIDPVHFGVVMVVNLVIGTLTPPFGLALFIVSRISSLPVMAIFGELWPFLVCLLVVLALITYVPGLVMWLPRLFFT